MFPIVTSTKIYVPARTPYHIKSMLNDGWFWGNICLMPDGKYAAYYQDQYHYCTLDGKLSRRTVNWKKIKGVVNNDLF